MGTRTVSDSRILGDVRSRFPPVAVIVTLPKSNLPRGYISWISSARDLRAGGSEKFSWNLERTDVDRVGRGWSSRTSKFRPFRRLNRSKVARDRTDTRSSNGENSQVERRLLVT